MSNVYSWNKCFIFIIFYLKNNWLFEWYKNFLSLCIASSYWPFLIFSLFLSLCLALCITSIDIIDKEAVHIFHSKENHLPIVGYRLFISIVALCFIWDYACSVPMVSLKCLKHTHISFLIGVLWYKAFNVEIFHYILIMIFTFYLY